MSGSQFYIIFFFLYQTTCEHIHIYVRAPTSKYIDLCRCGYMLLRVYSIICQPAESQTLSRYVAIRFTEEHLILPLCSKRIYENRTGI